MQGAWVWSLVRELRSQILHSAAKKREREKERTTALGPHTGIPLKDNREGKIFPIA